VGKSLGGDRKKGVWGYNIRASSKTAVEKKQGQQWWGKGEEQPIGG